MTLKFVLCGSTFGARIPNIWNQNPSNIWCLDLRWYSNRLIRTIAAAIAIVQTSIKESKIAAVWSDLEKSGRLFGSGMPFEIETIQHPNNFQPFKIRICSVLEPHHIWQIKSLDTIFGHFNSHYYGVHNKVVYRGLSILLCWLFFEISWMECYALPWQLWRESWNL